MSVPYVTSISFLILALGVFITRYVKTVQYRQLLETRMAGLAERTDKKTKITAAKAENIEAWSAYKAWLNENILSDLRNSSWFAEAKRPLTLADLSDKTDAMILLTISLFVLPFLFAVIFEFDWFHMSILAFALSAMPITYINLKAQNNRRKFIEQLPQAIDLMISVLRSGFSVPQAVKTVADEIAHPCGTEFTQVLQRMNFGQSLGQAFIYSSEKFRCYELDLIRRAVSIQSEIGGSLAELMDKTNETLKNRLKLVRKVSALTAQSKLTGLIVGFLPIVLGIVLNTIKPGYLIPLFESTLGKALLLVAVVLQMLGLMIMKKLATVRI